MEKLKMESLIFFDSGIQEFSVAVSSCIPFSENSRIPDSEFLISIPANLFPFHSISIISEPYQDISYYTYQEDHANSYFCTVRSVFEYLRECCLKLKEKVRIAVKRILCPIPGGDIQIAICQFAL